MSRPPRNIGHARPLEGQNFLVFGVHPVMTLVAQRPESIGKICLKPGLRSSLLEPFLRELQAKKIVWEFQDEAFFGQLSKESVHQGLVAIMKDVSQMDEEDLFERLTRTHERPRGIVCLDQLQDTRNLGAIVRAGVAFGLEDYVLTRHGQARVGEAAWKASAGMLAYARLFFATNLGRVLKRLKDLGYWVVGLDATVKDSGQAFTFPESCVFVFGSEHKGIREGLRKKCDFSFRIPLDSRVESLNVASAASIVFYMFREQFVDKFKTG